MIEQKLLEEIKLESDSGIVIKRMQEIGFLIDDIEKAFDDLVKKGIIREMISGDGFSYYGKMFHYEVIK